jgi:hypothetical protein
VEQHLYPLGARLADPLADETGHGRVAAVAVDDRDPAEALTGETVEQVAQHRDVGADAQAHAARIPREVRRHAERQHRQHRYAERLGRLHRHPLGEQRVGTERKVPVLFGRADREHDAVIALEIAGDLHPVTVEDPQRPSHSVLISLTRKTGRVSRSEETIRLNCRRYPSKESSGKSPP